MVTPKLRDVVWALAAEARAEAESQCGDGGDTHHQQRREAIGAQQLTRAEGDVVLRELKHLPLQRHADERLFPAAYRLALDTQRSVYDCLYLALAEAVDGMMITADHGNDPTFRGSDHTREYAPLLVYGKNARAGVNLGTRDSLADIGQTIAHNFGLRLKAGASFLDSISRG